jgi:beta-lactamase class A
VRIAANIQFSGQNRAINPNPAHPWIPAANPYLFRTGLRIHGLIDFTCSLPSPAQAERIDRELILKLTPVIAAILALGLAGCSTSPRASHSDFQHYVLNYETPTNPQLQTALESIDSTLRERFGMSTEQTAVGVLDLRTLRLAMIHPDREEYAASVAKIGILLAYFELHPAAATNLDSLTRHELGMMAKISSNEMAAKYSQQMGLRQIQAVLNKYGFYEPSRGGGIWVGKHYGVSTERIGDPVGNNSHAATVRQLLRYFLMLEQGKLVSPEASKCMREIFESPDLPHDQIKFVKGLGDRENLHIIRKWGTWEDWLHDCAVVIGPGRHYILVALTHHPKGDEYLEELARQVDDLLGKS